MEELKELKELKSKEDLDPNMPLYEFIGKTIESLEWDIANGVDIKFTDGTRGYLCLAIPVDEDVDFRKLCREGKLYIIGGIWE